MVESLVRLEQLVETLSQHIVKKAGTLTHHNQGLKHDEGSQHDDQATHEGNKPKYHLAVDEKLAKLEKKVVELMHQLHEFIQNNDSLVRTGHGIRSEDEAAAFLSGSSVEACTRV